MYVCDTNGFHSRPRNSAGEEKNARNSVFLLLVKIGLVNIEGFMEVKNIKKKADKRTEWIHVRLTRDELGKVNERYRKTPYRDLSTYLRKVLLEKPIRVNARNASFDQLITEMVLLRNELSAIGSNLNQIAKKINSYAKAPGVKLMADGYKLVKENVDTKISEIKTKLNRISDIWLQGSSAEKASGEQ